MAVDIVMSAIVREADKALEMASETGITSADFIGFYLDQQLPATSVMSSAAALLREQGIVDSTMLARSLGVAESDVLRLGYPDYTDQGLRTALETMFAVSRRREAGELAGKLAEYAAQGLPIASVIDEIAAIQPESGLGSARSLDDFVGEFTDIRRDWIVPDFLERMERIILTGGEGVGKGVMLAQWAVMIAAGVHPVRITPIPPRRVLVLDFEMTEGQLQDRFAKLRAIARTDRPSIKPSDNLAIVSFVGQGIDITTETGAAIVGREIRAFRPDVVCLGPLYQMWDGSAQRGDIGGEAAARRATRVFDSWRTRYNCALLIEAHAPYQQGISRDLKPFGSSVWVRWPEVGIGIKPVAEGSTDLFEIVRWRGDRMPRFIPENWRRGDINQREWMWLPSAYQGHYGAN